MLYVGGRTKDIGRSKRLRRYSGIQAGSCAVLRMCIITCPIELKSSAGTCRTSPDLRHLFLLCGIIRLCRLFSTFVFTPFMRIIGVSRQEICHGGTRTNICYGTDGCLTHKFSTYFGISSETNKWGAYNSTQAAAGEKLASPDTFDMVSWWLFGSGEDEQWAIVCRARC